MSPVLDVLAEEFRTRRAGRSATAVRDVILPFNDLLKKADCLHGPLRHEAITELETLAEKEILVLECYPRDKSTILKVRLPLTQADAFFRWLGQSHPEIGRRELAALFLRAKETPVPDRYRSGWTEFCTALASATESGASVLPFDRAQPEQTQLILESLPRILTWPGESLLRFASVVLYEDSKKLESLRPRIESCLGRICGKPSPAPLSDFGIVEHERSFLLHGPLRLLLPDGVIDVGLLRKPVRLGVSDLRRARLEVGASRCLTVENAAMLHELAKTGEDILLISSGSEGGYANSAVVEFLRMLPATIELWHFGDSDPKGFDILRDLRERVARRIQALHMSYRPSATPTTLTEEDLRTLQRLQASPQLTDGEKTQLTSMSDTGSKGRFEQEALGLPTFSWPFYQ